MEQEDYKKAFESLDTLEVMNRDKVVQAPSWQHHNMLAKATKSLLKAYSKLHIDSRSHDV